MSANIARIFASDVGLSTTTTSSGLLLEARHQPPGAIFKHDANAVDSNNLCDFLPRDHRTLVGKGLIVSNNFVDDIVFDLIATVR